MQLGTNAWIISSKRVSWASSNILRLPSYNASLQARQAHMSWPMYNTSTITPIVRYDGNSII